LRSALGLVAGVGVAGTLLVGIVQGEVPHGCGGVGEAGVLAADGLDAT
jgi:hypothetical protein